MRYELPPQMDVGMKSSFETFLSSAKTTMNTVMASNSVANFFFSGGLGTILGTISILQTIAHNTLIEIKTPANA